MLIILITMIINELYLYNSLTAELIIFFTNYS